MSRLAVKYLDISLHVSQWVIFILRQMSQFSVSSFVSKPFPRKAKYNFFFFSIGTRSALSNQCSSLHPMTAHTALSSAFFLHPLTAVDFRSSQYSPINHLNFGPPVFHLPSGFPRTTFFPAVASDILTSTPAHSSLLTYWYSCYSVRQIYEH
jgi:hypothetical protein